MVSTSSGLLSADYAERILTREVHVVLGLAYARPILEYLASVHEPVSFRDIDVVAVGRGGSSRSTSETLKRLRAISWVSHEDSKYLITTLGSEALAYAKIGDPLEPTEMVVDGPYVDPETGRRPLRAVPRNRANTPRVVP